MPYDITIKQINGEKIMDNIENNLFKLILVGVLSMGVLTVIPANTNNQPRTEQVIVAQNTQPIPQVIIVGKRIHKESVLLANK